ncbi:DUF7309 domain-containing protein [Treponema zioleckii]|uniref:DUF7309 domain-containing protein n=1 Tax=Treponema zioleckii TaxID=331680 RepID=UPI00168A926F|nr:hypothetical protein [Treponema zioleckii]
MIPEKLYELAVHFYEVKLWKKLCDSQVFAVQLSSGENAFCTVLGRNGAQFAIAIYLGDKGWQSFLRFSSLENMDTSANAQEKLFSNECLMLSFESENFLSDEELLEIKEFCKKRKILFLGENDYPKFFKFEKNKNPNSNFTDEDFGIFEEVLTTILMIDSNDDFENLYIEEFFKNYTIKKFIRNGNFITSTKLKVADSICETFSEVLFLNEPVAKKIASLEKSGSVFCDVMFAQSACWRDESHGSQVPYVMISVTDGGKLFDFAYIFDFEEESGELLRSFVSKVTLSEKCCSSILVRNVRTKLIFADFCKKTGITLKLCDSLPYIDGVYNELCQIAGEKLFDVEDDLSDKVIEDLNSRLCDMTLTEMRELPPNIIKIAMSLIGKHVLLSEIEIKLRNLNKKNL